MIGRKKKLPFQIYLHTTIYHENPDSTHVSTRVNGWKNETLGAREAAGRTEQEVQMKRH